MEKRTKAIEDYLEAILILEKDNSPVKSVDIASFLKVSKPAVARTMKELLALNYIQKVSYGEITLSTTGKALANRTYKKHKLLKKFLLEIGVSENIAEHDCCLIEHVISNETVRQIEKFLDGEKHEN